MFEFKLPDLGEGVAEGEILAWHVAPGDAVAEDDVLAEVETDKAAVDVPSPVDGVVEELRYDEGDVVEVGEVIITIDEDGDVEAADEASASEAAEADGSVESTATGEGDEETATAETEVTGEAVQSAKGGRVFAPPNVRRLARELGVEITDVPGSGPSGRVSEADVRAAAEAAEQDEQADETVAAEGESEDDTQLKSAVSRVGEDDGDETDEDAEEDSQLKSAVQRVGEGDAEAEEADAGGADDDRAEDPAVRSAVKKVGASDGDEVTRDQTLATPATRKVARELGVDVDSVPTDETRDGEAYVTEEAVRSYAERRHAALADRPAEGAETPGETAGDASVSETAREQRRQAVEGESATESQAERAPDEPSQPTEEPTEKVVDAPRPTRREPYRGVRRTIGEQMQRSRREIPHATHHDMAEVSALVEARERLKPLAEERGVKLTYLPFVLKSVAAALREHPILNTELDEEAEEIVYKEFYDVGVATATDAGLMVPVVRDVDDKRILEVAAEVNDLVERCRDRSIERSEMQEGTFTVTNFGAIGGEFADPIINAPQTAILGIGALKERAVAEDGEVVAKQTLPLSLAIDHRVVDGADAARFVNTVKEYLSDPTLLLLE
ncbi:pyruvate dehydrogenase E2 component (dihydrolipoamide acetyltransferase) [Halomicrobium zhouii]|uniref:Pyruvate dehydrogenase E2 component (Dihydrolipoamide acetyltransferase) n=1 Tax=Halomicrobium zhouii TaxID=767519 RepID=A0A1I6M8Y5_9EURY|nr:2-oxo acid dehydrogenase subunit E2 [Halomicrobium zhouii]SFS12190.1 pyruvate dehydrogenase E2 component (dihydrolipoamide acetyltransferase) [Halomicrobium zhouii]